MLEKLRIEQTKSRSRHSNDNALAESKNASVVRKPFGYAHITQAFAQPINAFYQTLFNPRLHRPCLFATSVLSPQGKVVKCYQHEDVKTPLESLTILVTDGRVTLKSYATLVVLPDSRPTCDPNARSVRGPCR